MTKTFSVRPSNISKTWGVSQQDRRNHLGPRHSWAGLFSSRWRHHLAFVPVFALTGMEGMLCHPLAFTKTFAMVGSTIIAVTLVPVLCIPHSRSSSSETIIDHAAPTRDLPAFSALLCANGHALLLRASSDLPYIWLQPLDRVYATTRRRNGDVDANHRPEYFTH
jgi:hypothetical protein